MSRVAVVSSTLIRAARSLTRRLPPSASASSARSFVGVSRASPPSEASSRRLERIPPSSRQSRESSEARVVFAITCIVQVYGGLRQRVGVSTTTGISRAVRAAYVA